MCLTRILSRLRSKHAAKTQKTKKKQKMPLLLVGAVSPSRLELSAGTSSGTEGMIKMYGQCDELKDAFEKLESSIKKDTLIRHLKETLLLAYHFDVQTLVTVLKQSRLADPSTLR